MEVGEDAMTIFMFTGTPGSGKSYHQSESIYWANRRGCPVVANFDVNRDLLKNPNGFHAYDNMSMSVDELVRISRDYVMMHPDAKEGSIKLFIDECGVIFNARKWSDKARAEWVQFMLQHRKLKYDVYLVTQFADMVDKQIRSLVEYEVIHRKLNNVGWVGRLVNLLAFGHPIFVCVNYWYPMKQRLGAEFVLGRKKYYSMYDTDFLFYSQDASQDVKREVSAVSAS